MIFVLFNIVCMGGGGGGGGTVNELHDMARADV